MLVRYHPTSSTIPSTLGPVDGVNMTSSPTSKGLLERMIRPVKRFSRISRPARPMARPPTPPMANTEFTSRPTAWHDITAPTSRVMTDMSLSSASMRRCLVSSPFSSSSHVHSRSTRALMLKTMLAQARMNDSDKVDRTTLTTTARGTAMSWGRKFSARDVNAAITKSASSGRYVSRRRAASMQESQGLLSRLNTFRRMMMTGSSPFRTSSMTAKMIPTCRSATVLDRRCMMVSEAFCMLISALMHSIAARNSTPKANTRKNMAMWNPSMKPCAGSSMGGMSGRGGNPLLSILTPGSEGGLSSGSMSAEPVVDGGTRVCRLPGSPMRVPVLAPRSSNTSGGQ
mmetsp:Transcript_11277/g.33891  ORF Transcript_11277/g.33891 Transcript_11277/m.33891 type:complete len:342 (+) Transcript_11277:2216-3241(+)